jgi:alginate O-acetyltransferase complex protein AlgI
LSFTSWPFVLLFFVVLVGLRLLPNRTLRQLLILAASIVFYAYWSVGGLFVLAVPSLVDYWCAIRIEESRSGGARRAWLIASLVANLGLLAYFKYANFFLENVDRLFGGVPARLDVVLPIGISFFVFKTLSYTIDVYRGDLPACRSLWRYAMFVAYFPELIAGPIVRASVFLPQMTRSLRPSWPRAAVGLQLILLGVTKKVFIADRLARLVDSVFEFPEEYASFTIASAIVAYSIQIYCDFSGYSDIAIGVSRIIGFDLPENFRMPYLATSITDFWRRWHITLSTWLRDYLYIPLGGNRKGAARTYVNLLITMFLGGLWHGASWTFVIWGLWHGAGLALHKLWVGRFGQSRGALAGAVGWLATYAFVCVGWVFFRADTFATALVILKRLAGFDAGGVNYVFLPLLLLLPLVVIGHAVGVLVHRQAFAPDARPRRAPPPRWAARLYRGANGRFGVKPHPAAGWYALLPLPGFVGAYVLTLWILVVYLLAPNDTNPFIYFQF